MALRFRCEHCGKRLQVEQEPGESVTCPFCNNAVVVPADAQVHQAEQEATQQDESDEECDESTGDKVIGAVATYLPSWGTSVMLHVAVILISLMGTFMVVNEPEVVDYESEARQVEKKKVERRPTQARRSRTTRTAQDRDTSAFQFKTTQNPLPDVADNQKQAVELIGVGGGGRELGGLSGFGTGRGGGGGADFFGLGGGVAKKIVYVVDRSGSMTDSIMYVKYELKRSIRQLKPNQEFYVVFYSSGPAVEMPSRKLVPATEANKQQAYEFIDSIVPVGQTDPKEALKRAFEVGPELVYLLTDGEFDKDVIPHIEKLNRGDTVTVNTICFIYTGGEAILQQIAQQNDGTYKYVAETDLENLGR